MEDLRRLHAKDTVYYLSLSAPSCLLAGRRSGAPLAASKYYGIIRRLAISRAEAPEECEGQRGRRLMDDRRNDGVQRRLFLAKKDSYVVSSAGLCPRPLLLGSGSSGECSTDFLRRLVLVVARKI